jgi:transcriptional regulator with XRE-family HTH domain
MHNPARLATYLRDYMEHHDLTTERAIAEKAGVSQGTINKILNEKHVRARTVDTIAHNLQLNIRELYTYTGALPPIRQYNPDGTFNREWLAQTICHEIADLTAAHQQQVLELIREFAVRNG